MFIYDYHFSNIKNCKCFRKGEILFKTNCSVCHLGGNNIIIPEKNLKGKTLEANGMNSKSAISYQILKWKKWNASIWRTLKRK